MTLKVTQEPSKNGEIILSLEVEPERYQKHIASASKRIAQRINIPGFRKGKAPHFIIENFVGREYLVKEAMDSMVPDAVSAVVEQEGITPFATPSVEIEELDPTVKLRAVVPVRPSIELGDYSSIRFDDQAEEVTEEIVDGYVDRVRRLHAYLKPVERAAQMGDVVTMTVKATDGDRQLLEVKEREFLMRADATVPFENFYERVEGLEAGESKQMRLPMPKRDNQDNNEEENDEHQQLVDVSVQALEVKEEILPPLDDGVAEIYGQEGINTLEELRTHLRETLEDAAENQFMQVMENKVLDAIADISEFQISPIVIRHEGQHMLQNEVQRQQAVSRSASSSIKPDDFSIEQFEQFAEARIKRSLIINKLVETYDLKISDEDVLAEIERVNAQPYEDGTVPIEDNEQTREMIRNMLTQQRTLKNIVDSATGAEGNANAST